MNDRQELRRLREIAHAAWHALEASEETNESLIVPIAEGLALSRLLPMEHPSHTSINDLPQAQLVGSRTTKEPQ